MLVEKRERERMKKELSTSISDFKIIVSENAKTGFIKEILNNFEFIEF